MAIQLRSKVVVLFCSGIVCVMMMGHVYGDLANLRTNSESKPDEPKLGKLSIDRALSRKKRERKLQEKDSQMPSTRMDTFPVNVLLSKGLGNLLDGGWRDVKGMGKSNQNPIPPISSVLNSLASSRVLVNSLQTQLDEVNAVIDSIPTLGQSLSNLPTLEKPVGQEIKFKGNLASSGVFGLRGFLGNFGQEYSASLSSFFESSLYNRFTNLFRNLLQKRYSISDFNSDHQSDLRLHLQAASLAEQDARLLGAQVDSLTSLFSGGLQIPFIQSLFNVERTFSSLIENLGDVNLWTRAVESLQQIREDLLRLPLVWNLNADQSSTVQSSVEVLDKLLGRIGRNNGIIDTSFLVDISNSLQSFSKSLLPLDGTSLVPLVNFGGVDISKSLGGVVDTVLGVPLRLADLSFLQNNFGILSSFLNKDRQAVTIGGDTLTQLSTANGNEFFSNLIQRTMTSIPTMLGETARVGSMLSTVASGLTTSIENSSLWNPELIQRVAETFNVDSSVDTFTDLFSRYQPGNDSSMPTSEGQLISFVKLLQLENAMRTVQNIITTLSPSTRFVSEELPSKDFLNLFLNPFNLSSASLSEAGPFQLNNVMSTVAGNLMSMPQQLANGLVDGMGRIAQLSTGLDLFNIISPNKKRRLQEALDHMTKDVKKINYLEMEDMIHSLIFMSSSLQDMSEMQLHSIVCLTESELEATTAVRAAAIIGNPVDVMKAGETPDSTIIDVVGPSDELYLLMEEEPEECYLNSRTNEFTQSFLLKEAMLLHEWAEITQTLFLSILKGLADDSPMQLSREAQDLFETKTKELCQSENRSEGK